MKCFKKLLTSVLVILLLINFIASTPSGIFVYADGDGSEGSDGGLMGSAQPSEGIVSDLTEEGSASTTQNGATKVTVGIGAAGITGLGTITGILAILIDLVVVTIDIILGFLSFTDDSFFFTIDKCVFNRVPLFNINYFNTDDTYSVGGVEIESSAVNIKVKESIVSVYQICRMLAIVLLLLVLSYIGIRMALSTVASDQAKYKKMLVSWVESVVLLFGMVYIMAAMFAFGNILTDMFAKIRDNLIQNSTAKKGTFEETVKSSLFPEFSIKAGLQLTMWSIIYWCMLFMQIKFFWLYTKRLLIIGLLIAVSPLIIITYSIDKVGDGKAQVFSMWFKEFTVNVLIQPLHALIYLIFIFSANEIGKQSPLVALALMMSMGSVERMVKIIFDLKIESLRGVNKFMKKEG